MVSKLYSISKKKDKLIIGLMSGTSLDGLDIALCRVSGTGQGTKISVEQFQTFVYPQSLVEKIRQVSKHTIYLPSLCSLNRELALIYAREINSCLEEWKVAHQQIDLIASHGQTIFHLPRPDDNEKVPSTLQIADADEIAQATGIITVSDFRMKHIAAGGEGAPLAGYGDYLLFSDREIDVVMLNIGGIANFTLLPRNENENILCSDAGPGNVLIDAWMRKQYSTSFDEGGKIAAGEHINSDLLQALMNHPFFKIPFPKTTGPEEFNFSFIENSISDSYTGSINNNEVTATLTKLTAITIANSIKTFLPVSRFKLYVSGGGVHNKTLMKFLAEELPLASFCKTEEKGMTPDAKEAALFALLANECISGKEETFAHTGLVNIKMGKISLPG